MTLSVGGCIGPFIPRLFVMMETAPGFPLPSGVCSVRQEHKSRLGLQYSCGCTVADQNKRWV